MKYSSGYLYQLKSDVIVQTDIRPGQPCIVQGYIFLGTDGKMFIYRGYAWNGCTLAFDNKHNMRASLAHDALYQLMQEGLLERRWKTTVDLLFYALMVEDGSYRTVADVYFMAVNLFGDGYTKKPKKIITI